MTDLTPPHLWGADEAVDELAERVVSALARAWGAPPWSVSNDREAEWLMSKLAAASSEVAHAEVEAALYRQRIDAWLEARTRQARQTIAWSEAHLCHYLADKHAADPKVKSLPLPSGKVTSREGSLEWRVTDPSVFVPFVRSVGLAGLVKEEPAGMRELSKALTAVEGQGCAVTPDGERVPGVTVERRPRTFKAQPDA